jgi:L,D-peptidoglycan transpeptidase YkuD (ErfK/YbiS/YcfS/YnhG family)
VAWKRGIAIAVRNIVVRSLSPRATRGWLACGNLRLPCALGRAGITSRKREGDGATPRGTFRFEAVKFRSDRIPRPRTALGIAALRSDEGWCDAASDRNYNRHVRHPYPASAERLWRRDGLYDALVVVDYNRRPRIRGKGSAIFMHVASEGCAPTEGCVALARRDLMKVLARIGPRTRLVVK